MDLTTFDLSKFGKRELLRAKILIEKIIEQGLPEDFKKDEVVIEYNPNSGYVFLSNYDFEVVMINEENGKLERFYTCPYCGHEGFKKEMEKEAKKAKDKECREYLESILR